MFDILKLLGGISSQQNPAPAADTQQESYENAAFTQSPPPETQSVRTQPHETNAAHNVMADVIERHERIANRVKKGQ